MGLFHAKDVSIKVKAASGYVGSGDPATAFATGAVTLATAKSWDLTEGNKDFEQQNYLGTGSTGFQNQGKVRKPKDPAELSITVDYEDLSSLMVVINSAGSNVGTGMTLFRQTDAVKEFDVLSTLSDGTDTAHFVMVAAAQTEPATKLTGEDGQVEYSLKFKCLAKDFYGPVLKD
jgi:hypothetical protein